MADRSLLQTPQERRPTQMDPVETFARNVRQLRNAKGLTQAGLAELAGLHMTDIARIETVRRDPGIKVVTKIAYGLGVSSSELMAGVEHHPPGPDGA